jgi:hypothetical protein
VSDGRADAMPDGDRRAWLAVAAVLSLAYALYVGRGGGYPFSLALLTVSIVCAGLAVLSRWPPRIAWPRGLGRILGYGLAIQIALLIVWPLTDPLDLPSPADYIPMWIGLGVAALVAASPIVGVPGSSRIRLLVLLAVHFVVGAWVIGRAADPYIDLFVMQSDGVRALVDGVNPYLAIYPNLYGPDSLYYGPGLVVDGELTIGFPYPPLSLMLVAPGELLGGDPRYAHLVAMELGALAMATIRPGRIGTNAALLYLFTPWTYLFLVGSWTEPLVVLMIALVTLVAVRAPRLLGIALGLLIATKQYLVLGLPIALMLLAGDWRTRWRLGWQSVALAAVITLPFVIWDPGAFIWSTVGSLAGQVFRSDSLTFLALLPGDWGPRLSFIGFVLLIPGLILVAMRSPRGGSGFAASLGFLLMVFFAFSRQGSANYHFAAIGALCCAVAAMDWAPQPAARTVEDEPQPAEAEVAAPA